MLKEQYLLKEISSLKKEVKKLKTRKKYGLVWEKKPEQVVELYKTKLPVLKEDQNKEIVTDASKPVNILIEGDNYHALSVLNYTHKGKVDVIYIDPPYNTGSNMWRYNNNFVDGEDAWRHSKWLTFMEKRLKLAKNLMKENSTIVVTIDDYEVNSLGLLMDEIFGEKNRIGIVIVENNPRGRTTNTFFATCHEYYLFYAKNIRFAKIKNPPLTKEQASVFKLKDNISLYRLLPFRRSGGLSTPEERPNSYYPIYYDKKTGKIDIKNFPNSVEILPIDIKGKKRVWRQTRPSLMKAVERKDIVIKEKAKGFTVLMKDRIKEGRKPKTIWIDPRFDASTHGTVLLEKILGKSKTFDYPKSLHAVQYALQILSDNKNAIFLDFFAGSGTTGHAVLEMNRNDKGNRKFILCTNDENGICKEVCYPRLKKIIGNLNGSSDHIGNLKYFKTDFVDADPTDQNKKKLVDKSTEMLCLKEDCFEEIMSNNNFSIFTNNQNKNLGIIYDDSGIDPLKQEVKKLNRKFTVYVFSLDESAREEEFEDIKKLVDLKPIPAVILNVYKQIFK